MFFKEKSNGARMINMNIYILFIFITANDDNDGEI